MSWDFKFNPLTGDIIGNGRGAYELVETAETMVYHQMICRYRQWWGLEELGSRLFDLKFLQRSPKTLAELEVRRCLGVVLARGRISALEVIADKPGPGRVFTLARFRDASTSQIVSTRVRSGG